MAATNETNTIVPFTFFWTIDNCPALLIPCIIRSPKFSIKSRWISLWRLVTAEVGNRIMCYIERHNDNAPEIVTIDFEIASLNTEGYALEKKTFQQCAFRKGELLVSSTLSRINVFSFERNYYIESETLTFRFRILKMHLDTFHISLCYARTRLTLKRRSFVWIIRNFSSLTVGQEVSKPIMIARDSFLNLSLHLCCANNKVNMNLSFLSNVPIRFDVKIYILDSLGKAHFSTTLSNTMYRGERFHVIEGDELMVNKDKYLPFGNLTLRFELVMGTGVAENEIEYYKCLS